MNEADMLALKKKYLEHAKAINDFNDTRFQEANTRSTIRNLRDELAHFGNGAFGLEISDHAYAQIHQRVGELMIEHPHIWDDVNKKASESIVLSVNFIAFIITLLAAAYDKGSVEEKEARKGGIEYHYSIEIPQWSNENGSLEFTAIVQNGVVKTGFFNWR
jgi:hypothetical protein